MKTFQQHLYPKLLGKGASHAEAVALMRIAENQFDAGADVIILEFAGGYILCNPQGVGL